MVCDELGVDGFAADRDELDLFAVDSLFVNWEFVKSLIRFFEFVKVDYLMGDVCARNVSCRGDYEFHVFCLVE